MKSSETNLTVHLTIKKYFFLTISYILLLGNPTNVSRTLDTDFITSNFQCILTLKVKFVGWRTNLNLVRSGILCTTTKKIFVGDISEKFIHRWLID